MPILDIIFKIPLFKALCTLNRASSLFKESSALNLQTVLNSIYGYIAVAPKAINTAASCAVTTSELIATILTKWRNLLSKSFLCNLPISIAIGIVLCSLSTPLSSKNTILTPSFLTSFIIVSVRVSSASFRLLLKVVEYVLFL